MSTKTKNDVPLWGMIHYELVGDGCLNGIWTNTDKARDELLNEIARKRGASRKEFAGTYDCSWIDNDGQGPVNSVLSIVPNGVAFDLTWEVERNIEFRGVGMRLGDARFVVLYWVEGTTQLPFP